MPTTAENDLQYFHAAMNFHPMPQHDPDSCPLCSAHGVEDRISRLSAIVKTLTQDSLSDIRRAYREIYYNIYDYRESCPYDIQNAHYAIRTTPTEFQRDYSAGTGAARKIMEEHIRLLTVTTTRRILNQHLPYLAGTKEGPPCPAEIRKVLRQAKRTAAALIKDMKEGRPFHPIHPQRHHTPNQIEFLGERQKRPDRPLNFLLTEMEHLLTTHMPAVSAQTRDPQTRQTIASYLNGIIAYALHNTRFPGKDAPADINERIRMSPIANEMHQAIRERFHDAYGRPLRDGDPLFPDFDSPIPAPMNPDKVKALLKGTAEQQGICPLTILLALRIETTPEETAHYLKKYFLLDPALPQDPGYVSYGFLTESMMLELRNQNPADKPEPGMLWVQIDPSTASEQTTKTMRAQRNLLQCYPTEGDRNTELYIFRQAD